MHPSLARLPRTVVMVWHRSEQMKSEEKIQMRRLQLASERMHLLHHHDEDSASDSSMGIGGGGRGRWAVNSPDGSGRLQSRARRAHSLH